MNDASETGFSYQHSKAVYGAFYLGVERTPAGCRDARKQGYECKVKMEQLAIKNAILQSWSGSLEPPTYLTQATLGTIKKNLIFDYFFKKVYFLVKWQ